MSTDWGHFCDEERICVIVPTYNNERTIADVLQRIQVYTYNIIVVNDGSTPETLAAVRSLSEIPEIVDYTPNRGKGYALMQGFRRALELGYKYAITIDSDGQHFPEDIPLLLECFQRHKGALIVGSRNLTADNMPSKNTFANKFSNFWFHLQTGIDLEDTQSGYRLYPLERINLRWPITPRYEAELENLLAKVFFEGMLSAVRFRAPTMRASLLAAWKSIKAGMSSGKCCPSESIVMAYR